LCLELKEANVSFEVPCLVINALPEIKEMLAKLFKDVILEDGLIAKGSLLYLNIDYKKVEITKERKVLKADCSYGFFYDRFVPFILKGDLFGRDGIIRREAHLGFNRPDGQLPLIKKIDSFYQLLGVFSFFFPVKEPYNLFINLLLSREGIRLIGRQEGIGEVIYSDIPIIGNEKEKEEGLIAKIQSQIYKQEGLYGTIDISGVIKEGERCFKEIGEFKRIPVIKEQGFSLARQLDKLKNEALYSKSLLSKKAEDEAYKVLNKIAESLFLLLRHNLIQEKEYKERLACLHKMYVVK
ncbi:MAG: hypothetical protein AB1297_08860, partial [bacterium]